MITKQVEVTTTVGDEKREVTFDYEFPVDLEEAKQVYTESLVYKSFINAFTIAIQDPARKILARMSPGVTQPEMDATVQSYMSGFVFGQKVPRGTSARPTDAAAEVAALLPTLTRERQRAMLASFGLDPNLAENLACADDPHDSSNEENTDSIDSVDNGDVEDGGVAVRTGRRHRISE